MQIDRTPSNRTTIVAGLILGLFLAALESTIVATAMPRVIADLGGQELYGLPFALYLLLQTVSGPLWGYASDLYGRRRLYLASVALFLAGSALSGAAWSMGALVAGRVVQGLGAGGVLTLTFTIIGELYSLAERSRIQGYVSAVWGVSALVGPLIGGFIVDHFAWRWVFYLNLPFGLLAGLIILRNYYEQRPASGPKLDLPGAAVFTAGAGLIVVGLEVEQPLLLIAGLLFLGIFPLIESRQSTPLVSFALLRDPLLLRSVLGNFLGGMAFFGLTAYLPLFIQQVRLQDATTAGAVLSPTIVGWTLSSLYASRLVLRLGLRPIALVGSLALTAGFVAWVFLLDQPLWALGAAGLVVGLGMGSVTLALLVGPQETAPRAVLGAITGLLLFSRNIGASIGTAMMGATLGPALLSPPLMAETFWRVPALSALFAVGVMLSVARLPNLQRTAIEAAPLD